MKNYYICHDPYKVLYRFLLFFLVQFSILSSYAQPLNFRHYTVDDGLPSSTVYHVCQDHLGFIWIATDAGVARFDGSHFQTFTKRDGLSDNEVLRIFEDSNHRLWFLTYNGNPCIWNGENFLNADNDSLLRKIQGSGTLTSFMEDSNHNIWLDARFNVAQINLKLTEIRKYNYAHVFYYSFQTSSGNIWLAGVDSFFILKN